MQRATDCAAKTTHDTMTGWAEDLCDAGMAYDSCGQDASGVMILAELFDSSDAETYNPVMGLSVGGSAGVSAAGTVVGGIVLDVATCLLTMYTHDGCGGDCHPPDTMLQVWGAHPLPPSSSITTTTTTTTPSPSSPFHPLHLSSRAAPLSASTRWRSAM